MVSQSNVEQLSESAVHYTDRFKNFDRPQLNPAAFAIRHSVPETNAFEIKCLFNGLAMCVALGNLQCSGENGFGEK